MWETGFVFHISVPRFCKDGLWCWRPVAQRRVRTLRVVFHPPSLRQNLGLLQRVRDLAVQKLIAQLAVETLAVPVLPRTPRLDVQRLRPQFRQPLPQLPGDELRPIVRTNGTGVLSVNACFRQLTKSSAEFRTFGQGPAQRGTSVTQPSPCLRLINLHAIAVGPVPCIPAAEAIQPSLIHYRTRAYCGLRDGG